MKILVLVAGVLDPKWPIEFDAGGVPRVAPDRVILSPFDESALEIALRLRDLEPNANSICALVLGAAGGDKLARAVAAYRIEDVRILDLAFADVVDPNCTAAALAEATPEAMDVVLIGREFGDCDDGATPALLAGLLGLPFFGRVQDIRGGAQGVRALREVQSDEETVSLSAPALCSVTNDRRNRLRKPLMKNVIAARNAKFAAAPSRTTTNATIERFAHVADVRRPVNCQMVEGPPAMIAAALADHLWEHARP